jgi:hypothetical protein
LSSSPTCEGGGVQSLPWPPSPVFRAQEVAALVVDLDILFVCCVPAVSRLYLCYSLSSLNRVTAGSSTFEPSVDVGWPAFRHPQTSPAVARGCQGTVVRGYSRHSSQWWLTLVQLPDLPSILGISLSQRFSTPCNVVKSSPLLY